MITRSATPTSWSHCASPNDGSPRQRTKTGRSEIASGSTIEAGARARPPRRTSSITSPQTDVADRKAAHRQLGVDSVLHSAGLATRITVPDG